MFGLATAFKASKFNPVEERSYCFSDLSKKYNCPDFKKENWVQFCLLKLLGDDDNESEDRYIVVSNTHLQYQPKIDHVK